MRSILNVICLIWKLNEGSSAVIPLHFIKCFDLWISLDKCVTLTGTTYYWLISCISDCDWIKQGTIRCVHRHQQFPDYSRQLQHLTLNLLLSEAFCQNKLSFLVCACLCECLCVWFLCCLTEVCFLILLPIFRPACSMPLQYICPWLSCCCFFFFYLLFCSIISPFKFTVQILSSLSLFCYVWCHHLFN